MKFKKITKGLFFIFIAVMAKTLIINIGMTASAQKYIYTDLNEVPRRTAVLVLGAMTHGTRLSPVLRDRVTGGIALIENGKWEKLLLSGDHGQIHYDEVNAMRLYVLEHAPAIANEDIFMDHAGFNTWDSMYRARDVFEARDLIIVTQKFHIARAVNMARSLGLNAIGYAVKQDHHPKQDIRSWNIREYFARVKAFFTIIFKPKPRYLGETIPISGDGQLTWD